MQEIKCYFRKIHNRLDASFNKGLRQYGLTSAQFDILSYLAQGARDQNTLTDISAHFGVKHTSAIHVLKLLEQKGFIERGRSSDARSKTITLTAQGEQMIEEIQKKGPYVNQILLAGFSEDELQLLEKMLDKIYTNINSSEFQNL